MRIYSFLIACSMTVLTLAGAAALNQESAEKNKVVPTSSAVVLKTKPQQPKVRKRVRRKKPKLKNIRQAPRVSPNVAITVDVPLEMPQVESLHSQMLKVDTPVSPPVPRANNPAPQYPQTARADGVQGRVVASALVDEYGYVLRIRINTSNPPGVFDACVKTALHDWKFAPATRHGEPVEQWVEIPFNFVM
jgi:protein TonB